MNIAISRTAGPCVNTSEDKKERGERGGGEEGTEYE